MERSTGKAAGTVMEEALLAVSALAESELIIFDCMLVCLALDVGFNKYIEPLRPYLVRALNCFEEAQVCVAAAGVMVDICRCIDANGTNTLDQIIEHLLRCLQVSSLFSTKIFFRNLNYSVTRRSIL